jgi:hypothetical protein
MLRSQYCVVLTRKLSLDLWRITQATATCRSVVDGVVVGTVRPEILEALPRAGLLHIQTLDEANMDSKRAERRAQIERLSKKRHDYWGRELHGKFAGMVLATPAVCSCWMCGNPRKYFGERTIQERRFMQNIDVRPMP